MTNIRIPMPGIANLSGMYLLLLFVVVFGFWVPELFLTQATLQSVASQQAVSAMLALALIVPLACGSYDLSVGANINLAAVMVTWLQENQDWSLGRAIVSTIVISFVIGVVNALIIVGLHVSSFIATLGTTAIIAATQTIVVGGSQPLPPISEAWTNLTQRTVFGFQIVVLYLLVLACLLYWLLEHSAFGRYLHAIGGNEEAARLSGVRTGRYIGAAHVISGTLCGVAGVLYASQNGPSLTFGSALLLPAFAAAFLGSTQFTPGRFNVWGTLLAIYVLATGVKGLQLVTGVQWLADMFNGVALISAVAFAVWRQRSAASRKVNDDPGPGPGLGDSKRDAVEIG